MLKKFRALVSTLLVVCITGLGLPLPAHSEMLPTQALTANSDRERVASFLDREDVRLQLQAQGVNPVDVKARVAAMTDEEAAQLAAHMDSMPAGGNILGVMLTVFLVLLITDILGFTKVFPFTRPVR